MTEQEKQCYNSWLATSRSMRDKPFKLRKDFDKFEEKPEYHSLKKVCYFLNKFPQIKKDIYFKAPFEIYKDEDFFDLKFFASQKAIKVYTTYLSQLQEQSPDGETQITFIKESLRYIGMFCMKENIPISKYIYHKTGVTYSWMRHVKSHEVSIYSLLEFEDLGKIIYSVPSDEISFLLSDRIKENFYAYKNRYSSSCHAKKLVTEGLQRINKVINKHIKREKKD